MKRKIFPLLLLWFVLGVSTAFASGIDWSRSVLVVEFTPSNPTYGPSFSCFGYTATRTEDPEGPAEGCGNPYTGAYDYCVWEYLDVLGYNDDETAPPLTDCFFQAGDYQTKVYLVDYADNISDPETNIFSVLPSAPDPNTSQFILSDACSDESLIANGEDSCTITFKIRDIYGNPVTQLKGQQITLWSDAEFLNDANTGSLTFRDGTRLNGNRIPAPDETPLKFTIPNTDEVAITFSLTSLAPSISRIGDYLGKIESFFYPFILETPSVDEEGNLDTTEKVRFQYDQYTPSVAFSPWVKILPSVLIDPPIFLLDTETPLNLARNIFTSVSGGPNNGVVATLTYHNLNDGLYFTGEDVDFNRITRSAFISILSQNKTVHPILKAAREGVRVSGSVAFTTRAAYNVVDGTTTRIIEYPSGAIGAGLPGGEEADDYDDTSLETGILGVSVEGKLLGRKDKGIITDDRSIRLVNVDIFKDIREQIFANANRLTRGLSPLTTENNDVLVFDPQWFEHTPIVYVENRDVVMRAPTGDTFKLPSGKNTLLIRNGNLIIEDNYGYNDALDSFGIILINDNVAPEPGKGNIFVKDNVKRIAGTIFAEGGMMTIPRNLIIQKTGDVTLDDVSNGHTPENKTQLLFLGTLLAHNTLGGAILYEGDTAYDTPWGETPGTTEADFEKAKRYDLHFMRAYQPKYDGGVQINGEDCVCTVEPDNCAAVPTNCEANKHSMIIRYDGRAVQLPPPGFEGMDFVGR